MNETKKSPSQDPIYIEMLKEFAYAEIESKKAKEKEDKIWRAILQYEKENFNSQFAKKEVDAVDGGSQHPLVLRLLDHAENPFIIYTRPESDIRLAAKLIQDQHDGISKALEAALDGELGSCIHLLMAVSNEYPFTQNSQDQSSRSD